MSENIEKQAVMVSSILSVIAETGIETRQLSVADLGRDDCDQALFLNAVQWLEREGLISFERQGGLQKFHGCALRAKGFAVLGMEMDFQGGKLSAREATEKVKSGGVNAAASGEFLGGLFGAFAKAISQ